MPKSRPKPKLVPIKRGKLPKRIELTAEERLELENSQLKMAVIAGKIRELVAQREAIAAEENGLADRISKRLGFDVRDYLVDPKTGIGKISKPEQKKPEA
jgi:hypothetical protein